MNVCLHEDDYIRERGLAGEARWIARLSNGQVVHQDDNRPGVKPHSAWVRLAEYIREHGLRIEALWLQFRDHVERPLPENAEGYFFARVAGAVWPGDTTLDFYLLGYLENVLEDSLTNARVVVKRYKTPELIACDSEVRDPNDVEAMGQGQFLIRNVWPSATTKSSSPPSAE